MPLWDQPAVVAAIVTIVLGGGITALRYTFNVRFVTERDMREQVDAVDEKSDERYGDVIERLDEHSNKIEEVRDLIMGAEYQVNGGMLELVTKTEEDVEDYGDRIDGVERIQLKIRRRQREHSGGEPVAWGEDTDPPPGHDADMEPPEGHDPDETDDSE